MVQERYYWLEGECPREVYELVSYELFAEGATSIQELDTSSDAMVGFKVCESSGEIIAHLANTFSHYVIKTGDDENRDWNQAWRAQQKPIAITDTLRVYPPWVEREKREQGIDILLEAKQAFGTGTHESTSLVIRLMEATLVKKGVTLLDIGTGTGILAMYAEKLCEAKTIVTEIDPVTVECIQENFELNGLKKASGILGFLDAFKQRPYFDVILCNMIRTELWPMRREMVDMLNAEGLLLISGQLEKEKNYILDWFAAENISVQKEIVDGEWWAVAGKKQ